MKRVLPLRRMLLVPEAGHKARQKKIGNVPEGFGRCLCGPGRFPCLNGIGAGLHEASCVGRRVAGIGQRDGGQAAQPELFELAAPSEHEDPAPRTATVDDEIKAVAVRVATGLDDRRHSPRGKLVLKSGPSPLPQHSSQQLTRIVENESERVQTNRAILNRCTARVSEASTSPLLAAFWRTNRRHRHA